jgi:hypothetical protein
MDPNSGRGEHLSVSVHTGTERRGGDHESVSVHTGSEKRGGDAYSS